MYKPTEKQKRELNRFKKQDPNYSVDWDEKIGVPLRIRGVLSNPGIDEPLATALNFLDKHKNLFTLAAPFEEMRLKVAVTDKRGNTHIRLQQMHKSFPVFGKELVVHLDQQGSVKGVNGKIATKLKVPAKEKISAAKAITAVLKDDNKNQKDRLKHKPLLLVFIGTDDKAYLAWHVTVEGIDTTLSGSPTPAKWEYFVDSQNGKIIWRYNNEQTHTGTTGTGTGKYAGAVTLNTTHDHGAVTYVLQDSATGSTTRILTYDAENGYPPADLSEDSGNTWNSASQGAEVDCHLYTRMVFDYFFTMHGRNSYDDAGADMHIYAHCGNNWNNASWNGSYVKIGDGDGVDKDNYCTLDIIGHEWTHAVTEYTAGLIYSNQSGALNESMSDVFGALIDGDWLHGEDYWLKTTAPSSRNLEDPTNGGSYDTSDVINSVIDGHQPDHMTDIYTGALDYGGVHINSGIMNKAAYLIATGGTHRGISICEGLGREVLGELYYQALTSHLMSTSDFADMRAAVLDSLDDLYSSDARYDRWQASINNAFAAVGIGTAMTCPMICWGAPRACPPSPGLCYHAPQVSCPPSPDLCRLAPQFTCPPSPGLCRLAPQFACPPAPEPCPPSPRLICPPAPHGCLPGPDPLPFNPEIVVRDPVIKIPDIGKVPGIGRERTTLFKKLNIATVKDFVAATDNSKKLKTLADSSGISEKQLNNWRIKAEALMRS